jgi:hypothetical protein
MAVQQKLGVRPKRWTRSAGRDRRHSLADAGVLTQDASTESENLNRPPRGGISVSFSMTVERRSNDNSRILHPTAQG